MSLISYLKTTLLRYLLQYKAVVKHVRQYHYTLVMNYLP